MWCPSRIGTARRHAARRRRGYRIGSYRSTVRGGVSSRQTEAVQNPGSRTALPSAEVRWYEPHGFMFRRHFLAFDGRKGRGTREHFFHFMLGYLLPAAHAILERRRGREDEFVFVSCGPTMDAKTAE